MALILDILSFVGSIASVVGIIITIRQIRTVKNIALDTQQKIVKTDLIADVVKHNEMIKESMSLIRNDSFVDALRNMRIVKEKIVELRIIGKDMGNSNSIPDFESTVMTHFNTLTRNINDLEEYINTPHLINKTKINRSMDELSNFFVEIKARLSKNIAQ